MTVAMRDVFSSHIEQIGHDPETNELHVKWKRSGKTSIYSDVPAHKAQTVMNSHSVGKAVDDMIKPEHDHRYP